MDGRLKEVRIPWKSGDGNIIITQTAPGGVVSVMSDTPNDGLDRSQTVVFATIGGVNQVTVDTHVFQEGKREKFKAADGDFSLVDGGTFNVVKKKFNG